ncbi:MAG: hypothetical protein HQM12_21185 [SAR324 cluster bacterium]|nr:hypothetical protein [SAR324 cluster bacterium]
MMNDAVRVFFDETPLKQKINEVAIRYFNAWKRQALIEFPQHDFTVDDHVIIATMQNSFIEGLATLNKEVYTEKKNRLPGFGVGFIEGFVRSNLNSLWLTEFIIKKSQHYRDFLILNALSSLLRMDQTTVKKLFQLYGSLDNRIDALSRLTSFTSPTVHFNFTNSFDSLKCYDNQLQDFQEVATKYLDDLIQAVYCSHFESTWDQHDFAPDLDFFFTFGEIKSLILHYEESHGQNYEPVRD